MKTFSCSIISQHWDARYWKSFLKEDMDVHEQTNINIANAIAVADLATQVARSSATMVVT